MTAFYRFEIKRLFFVLKIFNSISFNEKQDEEGRRNMHLAPAFLALSLVLCPSIGNNSMNAATVTANETLQSRTIAPLRVSCPWLLHYIGLC